MGRAWMDTGVSLSVDVFNVVTYTADVCTPTRMLLLPWAIADKPVASIVFNDNALSFCREVERSDFARVADAGDFVDI